MATIIQHIENKKKYILLGSGYGTHLPRKTNKVFDGIIKKVEVSDAQMICASDKQGKIHWLYADEICVISVDGMKPSDLIGF